MGITIQDFIAGWIGGSAGLIVGHPMDTIKVRQQTFGSTMVEAASRTIRHEGIRGFYKGLFFPLVIVGPANAIFFGVYSNVIKYSQHTDILTHDIGYNRKMIEQVYSAGTVAGFCQVFLTTPVEYIKTVLQTQTEGKGSWRKHYESPYRGALSTFWNVLRKRGIRGLYKGFVPMVMRDVPASGLYTLTYELLMYSHFRECHQTPVSVKYLVAGGTAGVANWIFVVPFDVVKSRIQADDPDNPMYKGTLDCFRKTYQSGGYRTFFTGLPAILLRTFPVNSVIFIVYETTLKATSPRLN